MVKRFTYDTIEEHRKKGKPGHDLTDPEVRGLAYQKQGSRVYARLRVMNKGTKKRELHSWEGPLPTMEELLEDAHAKGHTYPGAARCIEADELLERIRAWGRRLRRHAKSGTPASPEPTPTSGTVAELVAKYEATELLKLRPKSINSARTYARRFVLPRLGSRPVASVTRQEIAELHASLAATPYQANRVLSLLSTLFSLAVEWGWRPDNPAKGIKLFHEAAREDWYTPEELAKLIAALEASLTMGSARAIMLALYTGSRPGEVLSATWEQFDLEAGTWSKPASTVKQKRTHHLALNGDAVELLRTMRHDLGDEAKGFVFPSPFVPGKPLKDVGRTWDRVVEAAGVRRLPLYTLRHSVGSVLANAGIDLYTIGKQLGHAQTKTTARYAHLSVGTQRKASDKFSELVKANGKQG